MHLRLHVSTHRFRLAACLLCAALIGVACGKDAAKATTQVAIKVNGEEVSVHQVDLVIQREAVMAPPGQADVAARRAIESLVDQELAAQAARKDRLDQDPRVLQMLASAKREVLARAYEDSLTEKVVGPTSDEIDRYYEAHPALFSQRRLFSLHEIVVALPTERLEPLKAKLQTAGTVEKMTELLRGEGVQFTVRHLSLSAEDVPLVLLDQLAALRDGQSLVLPRDGGARVLTLLHSQSAPVARAAASRLISMYLVNERKRQAMQQGIKVLRARAEVTYQGRLAQVAGVAASSAASSLAGQ